MLPATPLKLPAAHAVRWVAIAPTPPIMTQLMSINFAKRILMGHLRKGGSEADGLEYFHGGRARWLLRNVPCAIFFWENGRPRAAGGRSVAASRCGVLRRRNQAVTDAAVVFPPYLQDPRREQDPQGFPRNRRD